MFGLYLSLIHISSILEKTGSEMVIGSRFIEKEGFQSSGIRRIGIKYFTYLIRPVSYTHLDVYKRQRQHA